MAKQRHASNPAKIKAKFAALQGNASAAAPPPGSRAAFWLTPVLTMASAAMLIFSFAPHDVWPLAYVALVPWTLALLASPKRWWAILWCFLAGAAFFSISLYWVAYADTVGYFALQPYLWLYFLAAAIALGGLRGILRQGAPAWLALPVVWVALEFARAYVISGFPWFSLGHTQYEQTRLIQIADITSDYGVSFFVAMVNGAIVDVLRRTLLRPKGEVRRDWRCIGVPVLSVVIVLAGLLGYGSWRLAQAEQYTQPGPVIGLVQLAFPISLNKQTDAEELIASHLRMTEAELVGKGCQLVVWPETMLPKGLNPQVLQADLLTMKRDELYALATGLLGPRSRWEHVLSSEARVRVGLRQIIHGLPDDRESQARSLAAHAAKMGELSRKLGCPILAGGAGVVPNPRAIGSDDLWVTGNLAMWFDGGPIAKEQYAKMHLVPFGEYVPFKYSWRGLYDTLRWFVPPVMEQLEPGTQVTRFALSATSSSAGTTGGTPAVQRTTEYRLAAPICYEGVFARVCRDMVWQDGQKKVDILANMSNDGWFTRDDHGTTEQAQHLSLYVFRAIENRVPVVRAVNTGISASIDSSGRIVAAIQPVMSAGTLLLDGQMRNDTEHHAGHGPVVLVDARRTLYDSVGDLFAAVVAVAAAGLLAWARWKQRKTANVT